MRADSACPADPNIQSILPCILPIDRRSIAVFFPLALYIDSCSIRGQKRASYPLLLRKRLYWRYEVFFTLFPFFFFYQIDVRVNKKRKYNIYYSAARPVLFYNTGSSHDVVKHSN